MRKVKLCKPFKLRNEYLSKALENTRGIVIKNSQGKLLSYEKRRWGGEPVVTWVDKLGENEVFEVKRRISYDVYMEEIGENVPLFAFKFRLKRRLLDTRYYLTCNDDKTFAFKKAKEEGDKISWFVNPLGLGSAANEWDKEALMFHHLGKSHYWLVLCIVIITFHSTLFLIFFFFFFKTGDL